MASFEWLDQQYRPWKYFKEVVDVEQIMQNWEQMSASYLKRANIERNISYGASARERLDFFKPANVGAPVLIYIHGGYWQSLDKDIYAFSLEPLVSAGALVASINYTFCPEVTLDVLVNQVRTACAWVWENARDFGGDPQRLHVTGHSAGGHLAAMLAATDWPKFQSGLPRDMISSIIPVSGLFDLEPLRLCSVNDGMNMDVETARHNSPQFMTPGTALPVSVVVGGGETDEFRRQSREFADSWQTSAGSIEYIETPGHHHFAVIEAMTESDNQLTATILRHLGL